MLSLLERQKEHADEQGETAAQELDGSILALDVGTIYTRAVLLDIAEGAYRFIARGQAPTTADPPVSDVSEGARHAIREITAATGRVLLNEGGEVIVPEGNDLLGVDTVVVTASAGRPISAVLVGLMPDVSLSSGRLAAESSYLLVKDTFSLADERTQEQQIDALLDANPDLILIVGGTDGGAVQSISRMVDTLAVAGWLIRGEAKPHVLFAGNTDLREAVKAKLENAKLRVSFADNVRPTLEVEQLNDIQDKLAQLYQVYKMHSTGGFSELGRWADGRITPTAHGFGRMVRVLSTLQEQPVLGVDLSSTATAVAASLNGGHNLHVFGQWGMGHSIREAMREIKPENITRWLTYELRDDDEVLNYVWNKWLYPTTLPIDPFELETEYALAREVVRLALLSAWKGWRNVESQGLLPEFGTILLSGSTLTRPPHYGWSALIALDALQPVGPTRLWLDPYGMAAALGTIAPLNPRAVVQLLESGVFVDLGSAISITGRARRGEVVLRGTLQPEGADAAEPFEIAYGTITHMPLEYGVPARLELYPRQVSVMPDKPGKPLKLTVTGGELGLIIDARGRPWRLPRGLGERKALLDEWRRAMTEEQG